MNLSALTDKILRRMSPDARRELGVQTSAEAQAAFVAKNEKQLQQQISNLLRVRGIPFINPAMCKKSELPIGWPDFTIFLPGGRTIFLECKHGANQLEKMQAMHCVLFTGLGFAHYTVRTLAEAREALT